MNPEKAIINTTTELDRRLAVPMFIVAVMFLVIAGFLLPTMLYRDNSTEDPGHPSRAGQFAADLVEFHSQDDLSEEIVYFVPEVRHALKFVLLGLYAVLLLEAIAHWVTGGRNLRQHILYLLVPFMRLSSRDHVDGSHAWIVGIGWTKSSLMLEKRLANAFSIPMVAIALPILPLIIVQLFWSKQVNANPHLKFAMATSTALIWMAFVFEFAIMVTAARRKWKYCKEHWINLLIVALPMFGFLRLAALGNLFRLQQLAKTASVLRLRGLAIRLWRATLSLGILDRAFRRSPERKIEKLNQLIEEKEEELELLRAEREQLIEKIRL
jgi:voltage-gated potassium channel